MANGCCAQQYRLNAEMQVRWCQSGDVLGIRRTLCSSASSRTVAGSIAGYRRIFEAHRFYLKNLTETCAEMENCFCDRESQSRLLPNLGDHLEYLPNFTAQLMFGAVCLARTPLLSFIKSSQYSQNTIGVYISTSIVAFPGVAGLSTGFAIAIAAFILFESMIDR